MLALVALVAAAGFVMAYKSANTERIRADNRRIMLESLAKLEQEPDLALLLGVEAFRRARDIPTQSHLLRILQYEPGIERFLHAPHGNIRALAYDSSGVRLFAGNDEGMLTMWDVSSAQPLGADISTGLADIDAIGSGPGAGRMVVAGGEGVLQLWDVGSRRRLQQSEPVEAAISIAFSSDGRRAAVGTRFDVWFWDIEAWRSLGHVGAERDVFIVGGLSFSPDGESVVTADLRRGLQLWDVKTARPLGAPMKGDAGEEFLSVAFSPDGGRIASSAVWIRLWDVSRRAPIGTPLRGHEANVDRVAFSPDGSRLLSSGGDMLRLWDLDARSSSGRILQRKQSPGGSMVFSAGGKQLAADAGDGRVILWSVDPDHRLADRIAPSELPVYAVAFSPAGNLIAWGADRGVLQFRDLDDVGAPTRSVRIPQQDIFNLEFSPDGSQLAVVGLADVTLWDVRAGRATAQLRHGGSRPQHVPAAVYGPQGDVLATGGMDGKIQLWKTADGALLREIDAHASSVLSLAFSPDGSLLASGGGTGEVQVWRVGDGEHALPPLDSAGPSIEHVQFLAGGNELLSVSDSAVVRWDVRNGHVLSKALQVGGDRIAAGAVAVDSRETRLALLLQDGSIRLWNLASGAPLPELLRPVRFVYMTSFPAYGAIAFSPDGLKLATAAVADGVVLWDVDPASWVRTACRIANRDLTRAEWDDYIGADVTYQRTCETV
jgi:WD40 repeat protein